MTAGRHEVDLAREQLGLDSADLRDAQVRVANSKAALKRLVRSYLHRPRAEIAYFSCRGPNNPIPWHVFDGDEDPFRDDCLFCHEPEEDK